MSRGAAATVAVALAACSAGKPRAGDDAVRATPRGDAGIADATGSAGAAGSSSPAGDVQVRVEWRDVPAAARGSPGRTPCNTPRRPAVAPTTTWGIPDALVIVEGARGVGQAGGEARVVLADCRLTPPIAAGATVLVESAHDRPAVLSLARRGDAGELDALVPPAAPRALQLPIAGHAVAIALEPGGVYELTTGARDPESAWLVAAPAAVTDASGQVIVRGVAPGSHAVTAWLPPRAGQPGRLARGTVTVVANELAELVLALPR